MNELATIEAGVGALAPRELAEPFRIIASLRPWLEQVQNRKLWCWPLDRATEFRSQALARHKLVPTTAALVSAEEELRAAAYVPATEAQIRFLVGRMLSAIPSAVRFESETYFDAAVEALTFTDEHQPACFSAAVIAEAVRQVIRSTTFVPPIAELVDHCRKIRNGEYSDNGTTIKPGLVEMLDRLYRLIELRDNCEEILIECGDGELVCGPDGDGFDDIKEWW
jgi:hypothetical protein